MAEDDIVDVSSGGRRDLWSGRGGPDWGRIPALAASGRQAGAPVQEMRQERSSGRSEPRVSGGHPVDTLGGLGNIERVDRPRSRLAQATTARPDQANFLGVIVLYYEGEHFIGPCLRSIATQTLQADTIVIVDNGSEQELPAVTGSHVVRSPKNLGVAGGWNLGLSQLVAKYVVLVTQDVVLDRDCFAQLVQALESWPSAAIAGCKLLYENGALQHAGATLSYPCAVPTERGNGEVDRGQYDELEPVPYVTGAVLAIRRMPRFTPRFRSLYYPAYYEDPDICFRASAAGYEVLYVPSAKAVHVGNSVIGRRSLAHYLAHHRNRFRFVLTWLDPEAVGSDFLECETWIARHVTDPVEREALRRLYRANSRRAGVAGQVFHELYSEMLSAPNDADTRAAVTALESDSWQPVERWFASRHAR